MFPTSEVCSSLIDIPQIKYGSLAKDESKDATWHWQDVSTPTSESHEKVCLLYFLFLAPRLRLMSIGQKLYFLSHIKKMEHGLALKSLICAKDKNALLILIIKNSPRKGRSRCVSFFYKLFKKGTLI